MTKEDVLKACTVEGNIVKLPGIQLERKMYQDVAKSLELIGGKWKGGKISGFVFPSNPTDLLQQIAGGEKRNLKKEYQFFATPDKLADELVRLANIDSPELLVLEPSAGQGAIVSALLRKEPGLVVHAYELMDINRTFLEKITDCVILGQDFLDDQKPSSLTNFDRIVANPPFSKNQDIDHIQAMYKRLKVGGRMVSIASESWVTGSYKKQIEFREWLSSIGAEIIDVEKGAFKESGTAVGGKIIVIDK